ncbi:MAG: hypothetical protein ACXU8R_21100 [Xanthobacteraceae bacterium]
MPLRSENDRYYAAVAVSRALSPAASRFAAVATPRHGATPPKTVTTDAQLRRWFGLALCLANLLLMVIRRHRRLNPSGLSTEYL